MKLFRLLALFQIISWVPNFAHALLPPDESMHLVSGGGGVSAPSYVTATGENPAGLAYNQRLRLLVHGSLSTLVDFNTTAAGGGIYWGNGWLGGGVELVGSTQAPVGFTIDTGIAFAIRPIRTSFGISYGVPISGGAQAGNNLLARALDFGVLVQPIEMLTIGGTLYDWVGGPDGVGFGVTFRPIRYFDLTADGSYSFASGGWTLKPGVGVHLSFFHATFGYGFDINGAGAGIVSGITAGVGFDIAGRVQLTAYYRQQNELYTGLQLSL
jgi:hypothetical protein